MQGYPNVQQNRRPNGLVENNDRVAVLNRRQVQQLDEVMGETVVVYGNGNFPDLEVRLRDLAALVRDKLLEQGQPDRDYQVFTEAPVNDGDNNPPPPPPLPPMAVSSIKLNGGVASYVLSTNPEPYNDVDLMFNVPMTAADGDSNGYRRHFDRVKSAVLRVLLHLLPEGVSRRRMTPRMMREAYVGKMVLVCHELDRWSLISLGVRLGYQNVELKFVDRMRRPYEFSVDSFQITVDPVLRYYHHDSGTGPYPTVIGESTYGRFRDAMHHLENRMIVTMNPEQIRGGGLLRYCNLLTRYYVLGQDHVTLERSMCSRFFADFPEVSRQRVQMLNYISNHLPEPYFMDDIKSTYLTVLGMVIEYHHPHTIPIQRIMRTLKMIADLEYILTDEDNDIPEDDDIHEDDDNHEDDDIHEDPIQRQYQHPFHHYQHHQPPFHHHQHPFHHYQYHQPPFHYHHHHHHQPPFHHYQHPFHHYQHHQQPFHHHQHPFHHQRPFPNQPPFANQHPFHQQYHQLPFHHFHPPHPFQPCLCFNPHLNIAVPNEMWRHHPQNHQHRRPAP